LNGRPAGGSPGNGPTAAFSRERLAGYDPTVLNSKSVLVVGAGALGQNTLITLALSGVRELRVVDNDLFELHNRTRSPCYPTPDQQQRLGLEKARVVAWNITAVATSKRPRILFAVAHIQELGLGAFAEVDAVVSCVDNARARAYLADVSRLLGLPLIEGGFDGHEISLSCYPPARGRGAVLRPCWRCSHEELAGAFSCRFTAERAEEQGVIPAIQTAAATLGGLQAEATVMALHRQYPLGGRVLDLNIRTGGSRLTTLVTDPACSGAHHSLARPKVLLTSGPTATLRELLAETKEALGGDAVIRLAEPFVSTAFCSSCHRLVEVNQPSWRWTADTMCSECGGSHRRVAGAGGSEVPNIFAEVDATMPSAIVGMRCATFGLGPLDLLEVVDGERRTTVVRINGRLADIFERAVA
jgi:molybdopterin/thiamine biosynthesis adenylyltransferase